MEVILKGVKRHLKGKEPEHHLTDEHLKKLKERGTETIYKGSFVDLEIHDKRLAFLIILYLKASLIWGRLKERCGIAS